MKEDLAKVIGQNLKKLRENVGLTQAELAKKLGLTVHAMTATEQGQHFPRIPTLIYLADFYGVSVDALLGKEKIKVDEKLYPKLYKLATLADMPVNDFVNKNLENTIAQFSSALSEMSNAESKAKSAVQSVFRFVSKSR